MSFNKQCEKCKETIATTIFSRKYLCQPCFNEGKHSEANKEKRAELQQRIQEYFKKQEQEASSHVR